MKTLNKVFALLSLITILGINNINAQCVASFTTVDNGNGNYTFTSTSVGNDFVSWYFGDATWNNTDDVVNHTYSSNGIYNISLQSHDSSGSCMDTAYFTLTVTSASNCDAQFTYVDNGGGNVSFTPTGSGPVWSWTFGDGNNSAQSNPNHTYAVNGTYWVQMAVSDSNCYDSTSQQIVVTSATPCTLNSAFTYTDNGNGLFSYTSTATGGTAPYSYLWNSTWSNDNTIPNPMMSYPSNGIYHPCLTVTDANGCVSTFCDSVPVTSVAPCNVTAGFTYVNNGNNNYSFTSTVSGGAGAYTYSWWFNGNDQSLVANPNYTFGNVAFGGVSLEVTDANGCSAWYGDTIMLGSPCNVASNFNYTDNGNGDYSFTNTSTGNIDATYWNFGDGIISNLTNPTHTFLANGPFVVELISIDSTGLCVDYQIVTIQVTGVSNPLVCNASFVMIPDSAGSNSVLIFNTSSGANLSYFWDFGDGNTSTQAYPFYSYTTAGPFEICLTVDDGNGCSSTYCDSISSAGVVLKTGGFNINVQGPVITSIKSEVEPVSELSVYPNPFKNNVTISLNLVESTQTEIFVIDIVGNKIAQISNEALNSGNNKFNWNANNIANGVYFLNIKTGNSLQVKKLILNR